MKDKSQGLIVEKEQILSISFEDFLVIVINIPENRKKRIALVGARSPLRSFLIWKMKNKKRNERKNLRYKKYLENKIAKQLWDEMKSDDNFFAGFSFAPNSQNQAANQVQVRECATSKSKFEKIFYFPDVIRFSLTVDDIVNVLKISPWKFVALHLFRDCFEEKSFNLKLLQSDGFHLEATIVDRNISGYAKKLLSNEHLEALLMVVRGEEFEESLFPLSDVFLKLMSEAVCIETLGKVLLEEELLAKILSSDLKMDIESKVLIANDFKSIEIGIGILENKKGEKFQVALKECYLFKRCEMIANRFSPKGFEGSLSCISCPQRARYYLRKSRQRHEKYGESFSTQCSLHNSMYNKLV